MLKDLLGEQMTFHFLICQQEEKRDTWYTICLSHYRASSTGLGLSHFAPRELAQGSAGIPGPGSHLSEPHFFQEVTAAPKKAEEQMEGGETQPCFCDTGEGTAVTVPRA